MIGVALDQIKLLYCAGDGNIKGIDEEFIDLMRFVLFVTCPHIPEISLKVFRTDPADYLVKTCPFVGDEVHQYHVFVFKPLCLLDAEQQRGIKKLPHHGLVLITHDQHSKFGGASDLLIQLLLRPVCIFNKNNLPGLF